MTNSKKNSNLAKAKKAKNDEFYTQYSDIEKEMNAYLEYDANVFRGKTILLPCDDPEWSNFTLYFAQNFARLGLKKLISTSYAHSSKNSGTVYQPSLFECSSPQFDNNKSQNHGKFFELEHDISQDGVVNIHDIQWKYLNGDGDFRSEEVMALRNEADIIVTNPPFSLFREFLAWIVEAKNTKQFVIIGSMNAITYKEVFPLIKNNQMWLGNGFHAGNAFFATPTQKDYASGVYDEKTGIVKFRNCCWFTNIDHGRRHEPLQLMTMADNLKFNKRLEGKSVYLEYDNYKAIEVPFTNAIPSDYNSVMGVPISFLDKYCPEQFEILGLGIANLGLDAGVQPYKPEHKKYRKEVQKRGAVDGDLYLMVDNIVHVPYARILIKHKNPLA